jgi:hypothetical protein
MEELNQNIQEPVISIEKLSGSSLQNLKSAAPWMKFISILGFIACGFLVIAGIAMLAGGNALSQLGVAGAGIWMFVVYILIAVIVFFPNRYLFNYASAIQNYAASKDYSQIEEAFRMQLKYWKYLGVMIIIYFSLVVIALIGFLVSQ